MTTVLFTAASFPDVTAPLAPIIQGAQATLPPAHQNDPVTLQLTDGTQVTVFDTKYTALRCMEYMRRRNQSLLQASDDVFIVSTGTKLVICESTLINQKLFASFAPNYVGGETRFAHRSMSYLAPLGQALVTVGYCLQGNAPQNNWDLLQLTNPPRIILCDWYYQTPTAGSPGTALDDGAAQLVYDFPP
jgi:hypothetical protein